MTKLTPKRKLSLRGKLWLRSLARDPDARVIVATVSTAAELDAFLYDLRR